MGRCQARWIAAVQLAVSLRWPRVDLGCAARSVLPAQFPEFAAAGEHAQSQGAGCHAGRDAVLARSRGRRLPHRCAELRDARPGIARQSARSGNRQAAFATVRFPAQEVQHVASRHPGFHRADPRADRRLRRDFHRRRSRRGRGRGGNEGVHPGRGESELGLRLQLPLCRRTDARLDLRRAGRMAGRGGCRLAELGIRKP